jgi:chromosome segregation ATPase
MKLTIKSGSLLAVASIMLVLIFGTDTLSHVKAAAQTARDHLLGILSTEHLVKVGREQLAGQKDKLLNAEVGLEKQRDRVKASETGLQELDARLAESRRRLGLLRPALEAGKGIGAFTHADVEALLDFAERTGKAREQHEARLKSLRDALASHEEILKQAREDYASSEDHLEGLATELEAREAAAGAEALATAIRNDLGEGREGISRTVNALVDRNKKLELEAARTPAGLGLPQGRVVLEGDQAGTTRSLRERLDAVAPQRAEPAEATPQPSPLPELETESPVFFVPAVHPATVRVGSHGTVRCRP